MLMQWEDVTKKSQMEIELAVYEFVYGNPQPIVDLFQAVIEESFNEGYKCKKKGKSLWKKKLTNH